MPLPPLVLSVSSMTNWLSGLPPELGSDPGVRVTSRLGGIWRRVRLYVPLVTDGTPFTSWKDGRPPRATKVHGIRLIVDEHSRRLIIERWPRAASHQTRRTGRSVRSCELMRSTRVHWKLAIVNLGRLKRSKTWICFLEDWFLYFVYLSITFAGELGNFGQFGPGLSKKWKRRNGRAWPRLLLRLLHAVFAVVTILQRFFAFFRRRLFILRRLVCLLLLLDTIVYLLLPNSIAALKKIRSWSKVHGYHCWTSSQGLKINQPPYHLLFHHFGLTWH